MANWSYTLLQLIQKVSFAAGNFKIKIESLTNPDVETQFMIECVNEVIRKIWQAKATPWNQGSAQLQIKPVLNKDYGAPYTAATLLLTKGSATGTLAGTAVEADVLLWPNRAVWLVGTTTVNSGFMRVVSATAGTASITLTFSGTWPYATVTAAAGDWNAALDRYELAADFGDFLTAVTIPSDATGTGTTPSRTLKITDISELDRLRYTMRSAANTMGNPTIITIGEKSTNKLWLAELDPFPEDAGMIQYRYKKVPAVISADTDYIPVPDEIYDLLANGVLALWKQRTGVAGSEQAFEVWKKTDLTEYVTMGRKLTDNIARIWPADTMRSSGSPVI